MSRVDEIEVTMELTLFLEFDQVDHGGQQEQQV